ASIMPCPAPGGASGALFSAVACLLYHCPRNSTLSLKGSMQIRNRLLETRRRRGLRASELAEKVGVSRQTIYAIEAGTYVPNTAVSLQLARVLEVGVEELFSLEVEPAPESERVAADLLAPGHLDESQPVRV